MHRCLLPLLALFTLARLAGAAPADAISAAQMQAIYDEVKTPHKVGIVLEPPAGRMVDCPNVFRHGDRWFMLYILLDDAPQGYTTQLATSDDLVSWRLRGQACAANAAGGVARFAPG